MLDLKDDSLTILLFHGVVTKHEYQIRNYLRKHIDQSYFRRFLNGLLDAGGHALSIDEIVQFHSAGKAYPPKSFVVTFDDGFENNFTVAAPILEDLNVPAVFYLTSGWIESNLIGWTDRLELCFEEMASLSLKLPWLTEKVNVSTTSEKIRVLNEVRRYVKSTKEVDVDLFVAGIYEQCGIEQLDVGSDQLDKKLTWEQVRKLSSSHLFTIGGHTVNHPIMAQLTDSDLHAEVRDNLAHISRNTGIGRIEHFSYPEGLDFCYSQRVIDVLKSHGVKCSPTAIEGYNPITQDMFHLRRFFIR
jgi:peptidoglycan/xylan/chitin deacetylase (PgdA/CDA1 family)